MMDTFLVGIFSAIWLGILTSISPCPLATNIAAISYIGNRVENTRKILFSGLLYTMGRTLVYLILGILLVNGLLAAYDISYFLQENINKFLGPLLILVGLFLLNLFPISLPGLSFNQKMLTRVADYGIWGAGLLGIIFALAFCPVSAALFFGSLIPVSVKYNSGIIIPVMYGIGTALPVIVFAFIIGFGTHLISKIFDRLTLFEKWARRVTGVIFIFIGIYYILYSFFDFQIW